MQQQKRRVGTRAAEPDVLTICFTCLQREAFEKRHLSRRGGQRLGGSLSSAADLKLDSSGSVDNQGGQLSGASVLLKGKSLDRIGSKAIGLYLFSTAIAICIGLMMGWLLEPGMGANMGPYERVGMLEQPTLASVLSHLVPRNPVQAAAAVEAAAVLATAAQRDGAPGASAWAPDAELELKKIPFFVRGKARRNTEKFAADKGLSQISIETLYEAKAHYAR